MDRYDSGFVAIGESLQNQSVASPSKAIFRYHTTDQSLKFVMEVYYKDVADSPEIAT